jgi:hypothetical protein
MNRSDLRPTSLSRDRFYLALLVFTLLQKSLEPEKVPEVADRNDDEDPESGRIRCPLCKWQPQSSDRWYCCDCWEPEYFFGGCGTSWNTFDTRGLCPGCKHQWIWTACLSCDGWSLHEDWYEKKI